MASSDRPAAHSDDQRRYNAGYDEQPEAYESLRAAGHMTRRRVEYFEGVLRDVPGRVLEIGSGTGTLLRRLASTHRDRHFTGVEPLPNYVDFANGRSRDLGLGNVAFEIGTGEALPDGVADSSVDLIISVDALHHVEDLDAVLAEASRVAAPGARWRAMEPNRLHPYVFLWHTVTDGERTFNAGDFLRRARSAGWRLVGKDRLYLYPSTVQQVPPWAERLERRLEGVPFLSGGVALDLVKE
ncbi:Methyltransferase domain-containing protein [Quadrisphaera granulorum]|uniref:Methyltransferase family protein n=1 Tax=Quadrisphaera granulorum TaxID=317664 RepID=A0A315ZUD9_9ACTN|nr:class I SAM-dependent methyltransferase [Quadrisphaera granulorum]PWJ48468.1 methyltransferase family protein [Quadrisphaera granulorum]SZE98427.1 Methyltransferase domain-containing protein [Quadrisphaera granulorum]